MLPEYEAHLLEQMLVGNSGDQFNGSEGLAVLKALEEERNKYDD